MEKIQISEEQAETMLKMLFFGQGGYLDRQRTIDNWDEFGLIKKSALEEAREMCKTPQRNNCSACKHDYIQIIELYEKAIKEIQGVKE